MVGFPSFLAVSTALLLRVAASPAPDVTIDVPRLDSPGTTEVLSESVIGASVLGVDSGLTRYVVSVVQSFDALENSLSTQTILATPKTVTITVEENDSIYNAAYVQTTTIEGEVVVENLDAQCTLNPSGGDGNCILIGSLSIPGFPSGGIASTTQYPVKTTPLFTITGNVAIPTLTTPPAVVSHITIKPASASSSNPSPVPTVPNGAMQMRAGGVYLWGVMLFTVLFFVRWV